MSQQIDLFTSAKLADAPEVLVDFQNDRFEFYTQNIYHAPTADVLKEVCGATWDRQKRIYWSPRQPNLPSAINAARNLLQTVTITQAANEALMWLTFDLLEREERASDPNREHAPLEIFKDGISVRPYQATTIHHLVDVGGRGIVGHEPGLGKTLCGMGFVEQTKSFPTLILCPGKLKSQWGEELVKFLRNDRHITILSGSSVVKHTCRTQMFLFRKDWSCPACKLEQQHYVIANYDILATGWVDKKELKVKLSRVGEALAQIPFKAVVMDEIHSLKTWDSQRTVAALDIVSGIKHRIGLTGTLVLNKTEELIPILRLVGRLQDCGGFAEFKSNWVDDVPKWDQHGDKRSTDQISNIREKRGVQLHALLKQRAGYIRFKKSEVADELPEKIRQVIKVEIDNVEEYHRIEEELLQWVRDWVLEDQKFLESISTKPKREQEILIAIRQQEKEESAENAPELVARSAFRIVIALGKLKAAKEWIDEFMVNNAPEKLIYFAMHSKVLDQLQAWYPTAAVIRSNMTDLEIANHKDRFNNDPKCRLLIGGMGTHAGASPAGVGHNLQAASHVGVHEFGWTSAHHNQLEDRAHRIGQRYLVNIYHMQGVLPDGSPTFDEDMIDCIESKRKLAAAIEDGKILIGDEDDIRAMFIERLKKRALGG